MRPFRNYTVATNIKPDVTFTVSATGIDSVYTYGRDNILGISDINWEMPFTGGLAKASGYTVKIGDELATIKERLPNLTGAAIQMQVIVNSNTFFPHVGRIRSYNRSANDPNQIELNVLDKFFDDDQKFPKTVLTDSWDTPHLEELLSGIPYYFGAHHRPFYHTAVTCDLSVLLGPYNVSSGNHVNSTWFNSNMPSGIDVESMRNNILMDVRWQSEIESANNITQIETLTPSAFTIKDAGKYTGRFWRVGNNTIKGTSSSIVLFNIVGSRAIVDNNELNYASGNPWQFLQGIFPDRYLYLYNPSVNKTINETIEGVAHINYSFVHSNTVPRAGSTTRLDVEVGFPNGGWAASRSGLGSTVMSVFLDTGSVVASPTDETALRNLFIDEGAGRLYMNVALSSDSWPGDGWFASSLSITANLASNAYKLHSVFSPVVNSSDIAISENPLAIADTIVFSLGIPFVAAQSSVSQVTNAQSYFFNCFFKERISISDILDEFGRITQTNMWIGDSGALNYRTFLENGEETVNTSLDTSHVLDRSFVLKEAPFGSSIYEQDLASKIQVRYNYDFQTGFYNNKLVADKNNTAECESLDAVGVTGERTVETKYILQTDTASLYLGALVRKYANPNEFVIFKGGADLFQMEIGDVFHLQHPIIVGSAANYQIIKLSNNYDNGTTKITGARLK